MHVHRIILLAFLLGCQRPTVWITAKGDLSEPDGVATITVHGSGKVKLYYVEGVEFTGKKDIVDAPATFDLKAIDDTVPESTEYLIVGISEGNYDISTPGFVEIISIDNDVEDELLAFVNSLLSKFKPPKEEVKRVKDSYLTVADRILEAKQLFPTKEPIYRPEDAFSAFRDLTKDLTNWKEFFKALDEFCTKSMKKQTLFEVERLMREIAKCLDGYHQKITY